MRRIVFSLPAVCLLLTATAGRVSGQFPDCWWCDYEGIFPHCVMQDQGANDCIQVYIGEEEECLPQGGACNAEALQMTGQVVPGDEIVLVYHSDVLVSGQEGESAQGVSTVRRACDGALISGSTPGSRALREEELREIRLF